MLNRWRRRIGANGSDQRWHISQMDIPYLRDSPIPIKVIQGRMKFLFTVLPILLLVAVTCFSDLYTLRELALNIIAYGAVAYLVLLICLLIEYYGKKK
jgi:hypothetical protein